MLVPSRILSRVTRIDQSQPVDRSKVRRRWSGRLYFLSRNPRVLFWIAFTILFAGVGMAWVVQKPFAEVHRKEGFTALALREELAKEKPDAAAVIRMLPLAAELRSEEVPADTWIAASKLSQAERLVATAYWASLRPPSGGSELSADLIYYAHYVKPLRYANELVGDHYFAEGDFKKAVAYYQREAEFPEAAGAREKAAVAAIKTRDRTIVSALANQAAFAKEFGPEYRVYLAAIERRWADLASPFRELQAQLLSPVPLALAAVAGLIWLVIALHAIQPKGFFSFRLILPLAGVVAGLASAWPALLAKFWIEEVFVDSFQFYMLGVAPREELVKLAFFIPFVPILLFRNSRLEMLVTAGCVGLGFAVWENLMFYRQFGLAVAFPRFLTANFFHLALTGVNGLVLCDFLRKPVRKLLPLIGTLLLTVAAHGVCDLLASLEHLPIMMLGATIIYVLVGLWFFRKLRVLRNGSRDQFSIAATFVIGVALLAVTILASASSELGFIVAMTVFTFAGAGMIMVAYMSYWQLGEGASAGGPTTTPYY